MTPTEAFSALLARPDEPGIRRGRRWTCARHPLGPCGPLCQRTASSDPDVLKRDLATAYVAYRVQEEQAGGDISCVVSVRRRALLRACDERRRA